MTEAGSVVVRAIGTPAMHATAHGTLQGQMPLNAVVSLRLGTDQIGREIANGTPLGAVVPHWTHEIGEIVTANPLAPAVIRQSMQCPHQQQVMQMPLGLRRHPVPLNPRPRNKRRVATLWKALRS